MCAPKLKRKIVQKGDVQSFSEGCAANDMVAGARLVSRTVVAATREDAAFFGVEPGCELIVVERVRTADGVPVMLENNAFVLAALLYGGVLYRCGRAAPAARTPKDRGLALRVRHLTFTDRTI